MYDLALQAVVKNALEPEWEAKFEPNSYILVTTKKISRESH
jgi:retron-type reverse transcriptase